MGFLHTYNLKDFIDKYNLTMYYESGVGTGTGFKYAKTFNFKKFFGSEIAQGRLEPLIEEFKNDSTVDLYWGNSIYHLQLVLNENPNENFLFWLDGHYPAENYNNGTIEELLPLKKELEIIFNHSGNNVVIIDDLRIYEDADYEGGRLPEWAVGDKTGFNIPDRYNQERSLQHEGYLILTPKELKIEEPIETEPEKPVVKKGKKPTNKK